jgi:hypothetical protein
MLHLSHHARRLRGGEEECSKRSAAEKRGRIGRVARCIAGDPVGTGEKLRKGRKGLEARRK